MLKEAIEEALAPMREKVIALETENTRLRTVAEFEAANVEAPSYTGIYHGRPDSAMHVTLATRPVRDAPELYHKPVQGVPSVPRG